MKSNEISELEALFHAWGIQSSYYSTKYCRLFKQYTENSLEREELIQIVKYPEQLVLSKAKEEIEEAKSLGISCVSILSADYPKALFEIDDPPLIIFVSGKKPWTQELLSTSALFAIVGSRKITPYGSFTTRKLARAASDLGVTVVSGLAYGVDKCAHEGALDGQADCPTIAVLGSGLLEIYPAMHKNLAEYIIEEGGFLMSEYGLRTSPRSHLFPRRNRIISGLSLGVLVVEAEEKSGSLITARLGMEQGREVYAVPGPIDAATSKGCNKILSEGATPVLSEEDFILSLQEKLSQMYPALVKDKKKSRNKVINLKPEIRLHSKESSKEGKKAKCDRAFNDKESLIIEKINEGYTTYDDLADLKLLAESELRVVLLELQMKDKITETSGMYSAHDI